MKTMAPEERMDTDRLAALESRVHGGLNGYLDACLAVAEIHDEAIWKASGIPTWKLYCDRRFIVSLRHVYRMIEAARVWRRLEEMGFSELPATVSQVRQLGTLEPDEMREVWNTVLSATPDTTDMARAEVLNSEVEATLASSPRVGRVSARKAKQQPKEPRTAAHEYRFQVNAVCKGVKAALMRRDTAAAIALIRNFQREAINA